MLLGALLTCSAAAGESVTLTILEPSEDRWMYPSNGTPGFRAQASTFSALPAAGDQDDRFGQFIVKFDTESAGIPTGLGAENYEINSISLSAVIAQDRLFRYDPSEDHWSTYGYLALPDADSGRPLELFGTGFRNENEASTFTETSPMGDASRGKRNAYALGFDPSGAPRDVSNNVTDGFEPAPWAIAEISGLSTGDLVPVDTTVIYHISHGQADIGRYLRESLNQGFIWLTVTSLHPALQQGGEFVSYYTKEDPVHELFGDSAPRLSISYNLPELGFNSFERKSSGEVALSFVALPGFSYVLQASPDLTENSWMDLETFSTQTARSFSWQQNSPQEKRFFRLSRTPLSL
ncbi:hypothetical protein ACFSSA_00595 [Luteolibacter algae]|uniref:PEP-CTERM sorting domain-containing protein n=1 Tax=Luteolibacter algae TaxID=454151 RepID=A0ABW5D408_9BACT